MRAISVFWSGWFFLRGICSHESTFGITMEDGVETHTYTYTYTYATPATTSTTSAVRQFSMKNNNTYPRKGTMRGRREEGEICAPEHAYSRPHTEGHMHALPPSPTSLLCMS